MFRQVSIPSYLGMIYLVLRVVVQSCSLHFRCIILSVIQHYKPKPKLSHTQWIFVSPSGVTRSSKHVICLIWSNAFRSRDMPRADSRLIPCRQDLLTRYKNLTLERYQALRYHGGYGKQFKLEPGRGYPPRWIWRCGRCM